MKPIWALQPVARFSPVWTSLSHHSVTGFWRRIGPISWLAAMRANGSFFLAKYSEPFGPVPWVGSVSFPSWGWNPPSALGWSRLAKPARMVEHCAPVPAQTRRKRPVSGCDPSVTLLRHSPRCGASQSGAVSVERMMANHYRLANRCSSKAPARPRLR